MLVLLASVDQPECTRLEEVVSQHHRVCAGAVTHVQTLAEVSMLREDKLVLGNSRRHHALFASVVLPIAPADGQEGAVFTVHCLDHVDDGRWRANEVAVGSDDHEVEVLRPFDLTERFEIGMLAPLRHRATFEGPQALVERPKEVSGKPEVQHASFSFHSLA